MLMYRHGFLRSHFWKIDFHVFGKFRLQRPYLTIDASALSERAAITQHRGLGTYVQPPEPSVTSGAKANHLDSALRPVFDEVVDKSIDRACTQVRADIDQWWPRRSNVRSWNQQMDEGIDQVALSNS